MFHLDSRIADALEKYEAAKATLKTVAEEVQKNCKHPFVCEKPTTGGTYFSPIGPTRICLVCRNEQHAPAYNDWLSHGDKNYNYPEDTLVLTEDQCNVNTVYALRLL